MTKKYLTRLLQASLMCCLAVLFAACEDFATEDNPIPSYISLSNSDVKLAIGDTYVRQAIVAGSAVVTYSSSDETVATVDQGGKVTALKAGTAVITAEATGYSGGGKKIYVPEKKSYKVTVLPSLPLTLEAITAGTIIVNSPQEGMQYTLNDGAKTPVTTTAIDVTVGDKVAFYGSGTSITSYNGTYIKGGTAQLKVYGNIMSLVDEENFATATTLATNKTFYGFFDSNDKLIDASGLLLPATTLTEECYEYMFSFCTSLTTAPALPATKLAEGCYANMFYSCSSLTAAPALPATQLAENCYYGMFGGCSSLTTAPALPATQLAENCYLGMFSDCSSLTAAPALPATELAQNCYSGMFSDCSSLAAAPALPATQLAASCYCLMFLGCSSLTAAPALPATTLAENCYSSMFFSCSSLTTAPALPATQLAEGCYSTMFYSCSSLTTAPALPATTLAENCYLGMFLCCSSLTTAYVKAGYDSNDCGLIFSGCPNLNTCTLYTDGDWSSYGDISNWTKAAYSTE